MLVLNTVFFFLMRLAFTVVANFFKGLFFSTETSPLPVALHSTSVEKAPEPSPPCITRELISLADSSPFPDSDSDSIIGSDNEDTRLDIEDTELDIEAQSNKHPTSENIDTNVDSVIDCKDVDLDFEMEKKLSAISNNDDVDVDDDISDKQSFSDMVSEAFLTFQVLSAVVTFALALSNVPKTPGTMWQQYSVLYGVVLNSGYLNTLISIGVKYAQATDTNSIMPKAQKSRFSWYVVNLYGIIIPSVFTHILPGLIAYFWVLMILSFPLSMGFVFLKVFSESSYCAGVKGTHFMDFAYEFMARLLFLFACQTLFNYMYILYSFDSSTLTPQQYIDVIVIEYKLRSQSVCLFYHFTDNISSGLAFFSWL